jgi:hypothetical protein
MILHPFGVRAFRHARKRAYGTPPETGGNQMSDATPTPEVVTPEPVAPEPTPAVTPAEPDWLPARLDRAKRSAVSEALKELGVEDLDTAKAAIEEAKRIKAAQMTDVEKAQQEAADKAARVVELEATLKERDLRDMRLKVAAETGLPEVLAAKLGGEDEDAMKAEAKAILAALPPTSQGLPPAAGDVKPPDPADEDPFLAGMKRGMGQ